MTNRTRVFVAIAVVASVAAVWFAWRTQRRSQISIRKNAAANVELIDVVSTYSTNESNGDAEFKDVAIRADASVVEVRRVGAEATVIVVPPGMSAGFVACHADGADPKIGTLFPHETVRVVGIVAGLSETGEVVLDDCTVE